MTFVSAGFERSKISSIAKMVSEIVNTPKPGSLIGELAGRPLPFRVITDDQLRAGLTGAGLPPPAVDIVAGIQASFAAGVFDILTGDVERLAGRSPKPLREVLAAALKPKEKS